MLHLQTKDLGRKGAIGNGFGREHVSKGGFLGKIGHQELASGAKTTEGCSGNGPEALGLTSLKGQLGRVVELGCELTGSEGLDV